MSKLIRDSVKTDIVNIKTQISTLQEEAYLIRACVGLVECYEMLNMALGMQTIRNKVADLKAKLLT